MFSRAALYESRTIGNEVPPANNEIRDSDSCARTLFPRYIWFKDEIRPFHPDAVGVLSMNGQSPLYYFANGSIDRLSQYCLIERSLV